MSEWLAGQFDEDTHVHIHNLAISFTAIQDGCDNDQGVSIDEVSDTSLDFWAWGNGDKVKFESSCELKRPEE